LKVLLKIDSFIQQVDSVQTYERDETATKVQSTGKPQIVREPLPG
jgi:hypothetical protein